ncbi:unnamed protein product [Bursaphelenchus okinawaensis]|uniref:Uncharacterized protein n=1 Tax=Bursaphelenchus okinawaensis TaxID=465554 RepID=A0A811LJ96_9BILA|nr:unnamed protein product [Bursaphelenchus okinawaensis]CAG9123477.1 unnamed protein product [Bursaphelenchus okinawaensis]
MKKNDPFWKCACGFTVHNAMFFVSFVGIVISVASVVIGIMSKNYSDAALNVISLITYFLVFLARLLHKPWLYLPLIVFHSASEVVAVLLAILKLLIYFNFVKAAQFAWVEALWFNLDPTLMTAIFCIFGVFDCLLQMYFITLAWRAYLFMKKFIVTEYKTTVATIQSFHHKK